MTYSFFKQGSAEQAVTGEGQMKPTTFGASDFTDKIRMKVGGGKNTATIFLTGTWTPNV